MERHARMKCFAAPAARALPALLAAVAAAATPDEHAAFVDKGAARSVREVGATWQRGDGYLQAEGMFNYLVGGKSLGKGDFTIRAKLSLDRLDATAAALAIGAGNFGFDGAGRRLFVERGAFGPTRTVGDATKFIAPGKAFDVEAVRKDGELAIRIDGSQVYRGPHPPEAVAFVAVRPWRGKMKVYDFSVSGTLIEPDDAALKAMASRRRPQPAPPRPAPKPPAPRGGRVSPEEARALRLAIEDLGRTWPDRYPRAEEFLQRLAKLAAGQADDAADRFAELKREALLANPLLGFDRLLLARRRIGREARRFHTGWGQVYRTLGVPDTGSGNCVLPRSGFDNDIAVLSPPAPGGKLTTLHRPARKVFVGDVDLHWQADRLLFSSIGTGGRWQVFEVGADGRNLRQLTPGKHPDVDNYDACYLPNGKVIFGSTRTFQRVPCRGVAQTPISLLFLLDARTGDVRQLCFDQDHNWCPTVLPNGRVLFLRWEYSGIPHFVSRILFHMNPDGTGQMEYYGSNSYWPNGVFFARAVPGDANRFVGVISGNHDVPRMGELILFDRGASCREADGVVQRIPGRGGRVDPVIRDNLVTASWPKFLHPYPLSDKYFLVSCKPASGSLWGIYLADVFDNLLCLRQEEGCALLEPIPLRPTPRPPVIPDQVNLSRRDGVVYLVDVYRGAGLRGVPRGAVKALRLFTYHFQYLNLPTNFRAVGRDGPWEPPRILGTVPVEPDGSACFRVPVNAPAQPAVRVSWRQAMAFCRWLSRRAGGPPFTLPTEAQWEYACRAGTATALSFGGVDADFSKAANLADAALVEAYVNPPQSPHRRLPPRREARRPPLLPPAPDVSDGADVAAPVGRYRPNAWGIHDMHGNAAEWTLSTYSPYPYRDDDGRNDPTCDGRRVVRGGSFRDRPHRCRSAFRLTYPSWQRVFNVGFRVVCEDGAEGAD